MSPKRLFDLCAAVPGLVALAPLLVGISLWIKWDSPGPVLFKQVRVGRFGRPFELYKFRSMVADAPALGPQLTTDGDLRVTRAGRLLRRFKLDELPQLLNVVKGEMSLVGPRPEVPKYVAFYPDSIRELVLSVAPGITDRASIEFRNENSLLDGAVDPEQTYLQEVLPVKLGYYAEYARSHSTIGDFLIIIRTFGAIFL